jgi:hypothetical protein
VQVSGVQDARAVKTQRAKAARWLTSRSPLVRRMTWLAQVWWQDAPAGPAERSKACHPLPHNPLAPLQIHPAPTLGPQQVGRYSRGAVCHHRRVKRRRQRRPLARRHARIHVRAERGGGVRGVLGRVAVAAGGGREEGARHVWRVPGGAVGAECRVRVGVELVFLQCMFGPTGALQPYPSI